MSFLIDKNIISKEKYIHQLQIDDIRQIFIDLKEVKTNLEIYSFPEGKISNPYIEYNDKYLNIRETDYLSIIKQKVDLYGINSVFDTKIKLYLPKKDDYEFVIKTNNESTVKIENMDFNILDLDSNIIHLKNVTSKNGEIKIRFSKSARHIDSELYLDNCIIPRIKGEAVDINIKNSQIYAIAIHYNTVNIDKSIINNFGQKEWNGFDFIRFYAYNSTIKNIYNMVGDISLTKCNIKNIYNHEGDIELTNCIYDEGEISGYGNQIYINNDLEKYEVKNKSLKKMLIYDKSNNKKINKITTKGSCGVIIDRNKL